MSPEMTRMLQKATIRADPDFAGSYPCDTFHIQVFCDTHTRKCISLKAGDCSAADYQRIINGHACPRIDLKSREVIKQEVA